MVNLDDFLKEIKLYLVPQDYPGELFHHDPWRIDMYSARSECTERGMWAIVTQTFSDILAGWIGDREVLEVMAGAGWLAKALQDSGISITPTDNGDWDIRHSKMYPLCQIEKLDAIKAVEKYGEQSDILIISWPPFRDDTICRVCEAWGSEKPIVYIGEGYGGCNAVDEFFSNFRVDEDIDIPIMSWPGIHDRVMVGYYRKRE